MSMDQSAVRDLYTRRLDAYAAFVGFFQSRHGIRAVLERADVVQPDMRVLDAGCGFGLATLALADVMKNRGVSGGRVDAFDLTPAMLSRFRKTLASRPDVQVETRQADVLDLRDLPASWSDYDLVISTSMLEYLPRQDLPTALANLRTRMHSNGRILVMITRKSIEAKILIEIGWHAERYTRSEVCAAFEKAGLQNMRFIRFPVRYGWLNRANFVVVAECP